eukprot:scaffold516_cov175-Amphora_coffeaeformis.AAC.8
MEEGERISFRCRTWIIAIFVAISFFVASMSFSLSSNALPVLVQGKDQRAMDISIALGSKIEKETSPSQPRRTEPQVVTMAKTVSSGDVGGLVSSNSIQSNSTSALMTECFPFNSKAWLSSEKIRNVEGANLLDASFKLLLPPSSIQHGEPQFQAALDESLCLQGSQFLTDWKNETYELHAKTVKIWTTRIVYLAITFHQHYQAWEEFNRRRKKASDASCRAAWESLDLRPNDYECRNAKFVVIPLSDSGLGANFKLAAMVALKASLATGRVALYINSFNHTSYRWLRKPWTLASCPRRDFQCFFRPPSPCVLTHDDYQNAYLMNRTEMRTLFRQGNLPHLDNERVVVFMPNFRPQREPPRMRDRLAKIGLFLVQQGLLPDIAIVKEAIQRINTPVDERAIAFQGDDELAGGLLLYVSRPRPEYLNQLQTIEEALLAKQDNFIPSIGLPIRGMLCAARFTCKFMFFRSFQLASAIASDKCEFEAECFSFETYLQATQEWWLQQCPNTTDKAKIRVLVTTESTDVQEQERTWIGRPFPALWERLDFAIDMNPYDVTQNTGLVRTFVSNDTTADQVMLSALSSLRAQLSHRFVLGNCCSNFHRLMQILVRNGCTTDWDSKFVCLQDHPNESFRL